MLRGMVALEDYDAQRLKVRPTGILAALFSESHVTSEEDSTSEDSRSSDVPATTRAAKQRAQRGIKMLTRYFEELEREPLESELLPAYELQTRGKAPAITLTLERV